MNIKNIERLEFGIDIKEYIYKYDPICSELREKKEEGHYTGFTQKVNYGNILFDVGLTGIRFYAYKITCKDFFMAFAEKTTDENPNIRVILYAGFLWSYGYEEALKRFFDWFRVFPGEIEKIRLSRIDICLDTDELEFNKEDEDKFITRAKNKVTHGVDDSYTTGKKFTGFTIGRGNPMLARIYNKTEEIKSSGKDWFKTIWKENGWDGKKDVWRVEYQIRRKALKEFGIDKLEELEGNEDRLWNYLTTKWLKMKDDKWSIVQKSDKPVINPIVRKVIKQGDIKRLTNQTSGLIISIGAFANIENIESVIKLVKVVALEKYKKKGTTFSNEVKKRRQEFLKDKSIIEGLPIRIDKLR